LHAWLTAVFVCSLSLITIPAYTFEVWCSRCREGNLLLRTASGVFCWSWRKVHNYSVGATVSRSEKQYPIVFEVQLSQHPSINAHGKYVPTWFWPINHSWFTGIFQVLRCIIVYALLTDLHLAW
jgi:hypothetical protein